MSDDEKSEEKTLQANQHPIDNINAVAIKMPPFWSSDPELWFYQVDALFQTKKITGNKTKFNHVVATISPQAAGTVRDIIRNPPVNNAYEILKEALIKRNSPTRHNRLQQLLQQSTLGDQKPSELLRNMRHLNGDDEETDLFKELFLQRMPKEVKVVLIAFGEKATLDELADTADNMIDASTSNVYNHQINEIEQLREEVAALRFKSRANDSSRSRNTQKPTDSSASSWCWYHTRFGTRARSCIKPCSFMISGNDKARC